MLSTGGNVHPWVPSADHASPHDFDACEEPLVLVADTLIGRLECAIGDDGLCPEALRQS